MLTHLMQALQHMCLTVQLQDLVEYKKFRNKEVASAARGLIGLFRCAWCAYCDKRSSLVWQN